MVGFVEFDAVAARCFDVTGTLVGDTLKVGSRNLVDYGLSHWCTTAKNSLASRLASLSCAVIAVWSARRGIAFHSTLSPAVCAEQAGLSQVLLFLFGCTRPSQCF
jgi:hypothetical protein